DLGHALRHVQKSKKVQWTLRLRKLARGSLRRHALVSRCPRARRGEASAFALLANLHRLFKTLGLHSRDANITTMELLILLLFGLLVSVLMLPFVALARANAVKRSIDDLTARGSSRENEARTLRPRDVSPIETQRAAEQPVAVATTAVPPPLPVTIPVSPPPPEKRAEPTPMRQMPAVAAPAKPAITPKPSIDWEQFMGAKLFAWIGGLALFLGVAFFVKYSFEHNLIPPELRVAIGFVVGL